MANHTVPAAPWHLTAYWHCGAQVPSELQTSTHCSLPGQLMSAHVCWDMHEASQSHAPEPSGQLQVWTQ